MMKTYMPKGIYRSQAEVILMLFLTPPPPTRARTHTQNTCRFSFIPKSIDALLELQFLECQPTPSQNNKDNY
jgi:hypothetical protein